MKTKSFHLIWLLLLCVAVVLLIVRTGGRRVDEVKINNKTNAAAAGIQESPSTPTTSRRVQNADAAIAERINHLREDQQWDWKQPIHFYGKVEDETVIPWQERLPVLNGAMPKGPQSTHRLSLTHRACFPSLTNWENVFWFASITRDFIQPRTILLVSSMLIQLKSIFTGLIPLLRSYSDSKDGNQPNR